MDENINNRLFCILAKNNEQFNGNTLEMLSKYGVVHKIVVPKDQTYPKIVNSLVDRFKQNNNCSFMHVIDNNVKLLKDPAQFLEELEDMMRKLKQYVWLNTVCDQCNYIYKKYNPRIRVSFDDDKSKGLLKTKSIVFTSNANTAWMAYDMQADNNKLLKFDERFEVPMFYIIELLARRRNTKDAGQLYYMNQYLSVESELGAFELESGCEPDDVKKKRFEEEQKKMAEENKLFQSMNIDIAPDNSVDNILEDLYNSFIDEKERHEEHE